MQKIMVAPKTLEHRGDYRDIQEITRYTGMHTGNYGSTEEIMGDTGDNRVYERIRRLWRYTGDYGST